jgi:glycosyltransferase involved in cell wall biosynthesis
VTIRTVRSDREESGGLPRLPRLRVALCEPYYTGSHRAWADGLETHSAHDVRLVTHNGGFWKWRMQGGALTMAAQLRRLVADWGQPDVLLVSDMVHVPALVGLARHELAGAPIVLYLHENQLTYPRREGQAPDHTYALANWLSMAVADRVVFNSEYHRQEALAALPGLLRQFPDHRHLDHLEEVAARTDVLPVGIDLPRLRRSGSIRPDHPPTAPWRCRPAGAGRLEQTPERRNFAPLVLWNHRWEYDKDPEAFFAALDEVKQSGLGFRLAVAGESFQTVPEPFQRARERFADRVVHFGTAPPDEYVDLLQQADVVVSTARHEFFGVAVVEAMAAGAFPILPDRLSYPELVPSPAEPYLYRDHDGLVERLCWALAHGQERRRLALGTSDHVARFAWSQIAPRYDAMLFQVGSSFHLRASADR